MIERVRKNLLLALVIVVILLNALVWGRVLSTAGEPRLTVSFLNVGQGDAIFIEAPNGNQMLIDAGKNGQVMRALSEHMSFFDRYIDVLLVTHPDADHLGGMLDVLSRYGSGAALVSGARSELSLDERFRRELEERGIPKRVVSEGVIVDLGGGVVFEIVAPPRAADTSTMEPNDASIVGKLSYGRTAFLLTGDAPKSVEKYLSFHYGKRLSSQVLKAGHHGSNTSTGDLFLSVIDPEYTIISAGIPNDYGHPDPRTIARILESGSKIRHTVKRDGVTFESNGKRLFLIE